MRPPLRSCQRDHLSSFARLIVFSNLFSSVMELQGGALAVLRFGRGNSVGFLTPDSSKEKLPTKPYNVPAPRETSKLNTIGDR